MTTVTKLSHKHSLEGGSLALMTHWLGRGIGLHIGQVGQVIVV